MKSGAGRFAPSPTGPLHLGSLLAATGSFLDARSRGEPWYVRIDDLDIDRNQPGAVENILRTLSSHGLHWDGPVRYQSDRLDAYAAALEALAATDHLFACRCTRKNLRGQRLYPGTCRTARLPFAGLSIRYRVSESFIVFEDLIQGPQTTYLTREIGDFTVRRRDGVIAYVLATAVDDGAPDISRVIRGSDLLEHTSAQLLLMDALGLERPTYGHLPLIVNSAGQKLSKQSFARPADFSEPLDNLRLVLGALGNPAARLEAGSCVELLEIARRYWSCADIPLVDTVDPS